MGYIDDGLLRDVAQIARMRATVKEVLPTFSNAECRSGDTWLYRVEQDETKAPPARLSESTTAMILFSLRVIETAANLSADACSSVLAPMRRSDAVPPEINWKSFGVDAAFQALKGQILKGTEIQTKSTTFGVNDPLTAAWWTALVHSRKEASLYAATSALLEKIVTDARVEKPLEQVPVTGPNVSFRSVSGHVFPRLRLAQLLRIAQVAHKSGAAVLPTQCESARQELLSCARQALNEQMAAEQIPDADFDPAQLVFALEILLLLGEQLPSGQISRVLTALEKVQAVSSNWRPVRAWVVSEQGHALLPLSVEVALSIARVAVLASDKYGEEGFLGRVEPMLRRFEQWLTSRRVELRTAAGEIITGWQSEHAQAESAIDLWETSQVLVYLALHGSILQQLIADKVLDDIGILPENLDDPEDWDKFKVDRGTSIEKIDWEGLDQTIKNAKTHGKGGSFLLYGPPGTGKTDLVEQIAKQLNWKLLRFSPSHFVAGGPSEVEARASRIFQALLQQSHVVVLFDEIDRLILDRDAPNYSLQGDMFQFMTPSMLVKLRSLWKRDRSIFFISTNYYERIDPAARRPGRVNQLTHVGLPDRATRQAILQRATKSAAVHGVVAQLAERTCLFSFEELCGLAEKAARKGTTDVDFILGDAGQPTVTMTSYLTRVSDPGWVQLPSAEINALLELLADVNTRQEFRDQAWRFLVDVEKRASETSASQTLKDFDAKLQTRWRPHFTPAPAGGVV